MNEFLNMELKEIIFSVDGKEVRALAGNEEHVRMHLDNLLEKHKGSEVKILDDRGLLSD